MIIFDDQRYEDEEDVPDFGTIVCTKVSYAPGGSDQKTIREYFGAQADCEKVADEIIKIDYVASGSILLSDTGNVWMFNEVTKEWKQL